MASIVLMLLLVAFSSGLYQESVHARALIDKATDASKHKGIVKTIEDTEYGVLIDCIDIYKQPALSHPLLKNHTIQMKPGSLYPVQQDEEKPKGERFYQSWRKFGECPSGAIPILRRTQQRRYEQIKAAKGPQFVKVKDVNGSLSNVAVPSEPGIDVAQVSVDGGYYVGAHAYLNVWTPVVLPNETSSAQIWLISNSVPGANIDVISAGWMVDPTSHHPHKTTFFIFWTGNRQGRAGCFNVECPGFVQVTSKHILGGPIQPISTYGGKQYTIEITIKKDIGTSNWWLRMNGIDLGYWPASLFSGLSLTADIISWGGQVVSSGAQPGSKHTMTQMGSGHFSDEDFKKACYIRTLAYATPDKSSNPVETGGFVKYATRPQCYDVEVGENEKWGTYFFFGGPGYSEKCGSY